MLQRALNEGHQRLQVPGNAEVLQAEVAGHLVIGIPIEREIVGAHRHAADGEVGADARGEQLPQDGLLVLTVKGAQGSPAEFVETGAEALDGLQGLVQ